MSERWIAVQPEWAGGWWVVKEADSDPESHDCVDESGDGGFEEKTAKLIAAAPEMLAELRRCVEHLESWAESHPMTATTETWGALHCARALIAKATT